ncbi:MAG: M3 family oligoendopeptidase, partial [Clostridiales bacterium]|nr:M3 family oligoendopeptidase [Clostridiales bacterium]
MKKVSALAYKRVDSNEVIKQIEKCTLAAAQAKNGKALAKCRTECLKHIFRVNTMAALAFMRFTLDTRDPFYAGEKDYYDEEGPKLDSAYVKFQRAFLNNPHAKETAPYVNPLVLRHYEQQITCTSDEAVPFKIEENKLVTEYTKLMAETTYPWNGENLPLSALKKYFADPDRSVRQKAYTALGETLAKISDKLDSLYDQMVKIRHKTAEALGFTNYVELGDRLMGRISYDRSMLAAFRKNVLSDVVPVVARLKEKAAEKLGIKEFMLYDNETYFDCGNPTPT